MMKDNEEEEDDDNYPMYPEYGDTARGEAEDEEAPDDQPMLSDDDICQVIVDTQRETEDPNEKLKLQRMLSQKIVIPKL